MGKRGSDMKKKSIRAVLTLDLHYTCETCEGTGLI